MEEKPEIKTVRVRVHMDEKASSQKKAGVMQDILTKISKKLTPKPTEQEKKREE